jgi:hypothetical protein
MRFSTLVLCVKLSLTDPESWSKSRFEYGFEFAGYSFRNPKKHFRLCIDHNFIGPINLPQIFAIICCNTWVMFTCKRILFEIDLKRANCFVKVLSNLRKLYPKYQWLATLSREFRPLGVRKIKHSPICPRDERTYSASYSHKIFFIKILHSFTEYFSFISQTRIYCSPVHKYTSLLLLCELFLARIKYVLMWHVYVADIFNVLNTLPPLVFDT